MQHFRRTLFIASLSISAFSCQYPQVEPPGWAEQRVSFFSLVCPQPCLISEQARSGDSTYLSPFEQGIIRFDHIKIEYSALEVKGNDYNPGPCRDHTFMKARKYTIENQNLNNIQSRIAYVEEGDRYLAELCCSNNRFDKQLYLFADSLDALQLAKVLDVFKTVKFPDGE